MKLERMGRDGMEEDKDRKSIIRDAGINGEHRERNKKQNMKEKKEKTKMEKQ